MKSTARRQRRAELGAVAGRGAHGLGMLCPAWQAVAKALYERAIMRSRVIATI